MMATEYRDLLNELRAALDAYRERRLDLDELKTRIWNAAQQVSSHEDRQLRQALQSAEGKLDMVQFTTSVDEVFTTTLEIVSALDSRLHDALQPQ